VRRLAALPPIEYDLVRQADADTLGVRVSTLDFEVEKLRRETAGSEADGQGEAVLFPELELWHEPVDGAELLTDLADTFSLYVILPKLAKVALALWTVFTHAIGYVNIAPILGITAPQHRCGKSTVLSLLMRLVLRPMPAANISPAAVFRSVELWSPSLLIDEADSFLRDNEEMRGIINSGHARSGVRGPSLR
jgi:putative DNA primase/helicase